MTAKEIKSKIADLLKLSEEKTELATMTLENGTVLEAEAFEPGNEIFIIADDERTPLPVGEYEMEGGLVLVVTEEGVIDSIVEPEAEEEVEEEVEVEAEKKKDEFATMDEFNELKEMVGSLMNIVENLAKQEPKKEELSAEEKGELKHSPEKETKKAIKLDAFKPSPTLSRILKSINK